MAKVSVIIPDYNQSKYVAGAIRSVLQQSYTDYEIIVVDDGSTDHPWEVLSQFQDQIIYIRQENQGLAGARNTGIRAASGDLIGLLDADDEWCPTYLEQMVTFSETHPDAVVFYCMAQCMDGNGLDLPQVVGGPPVDPNLLYHRLLRANFIIPSTVTFRRKPIINAGYFDPNLRSCEDWDLWLRLLPAEKILGDCRSLVRYRIHGSSLSTNVDAMHDAVKRVVEKHFGPDDGQIESWSREKRRAYGGVYRYCLISSVQRQNNWQAGQLYLQKAFRVDPSLATDIDLFYELALGLQPHGYRGSTHYLDIDQNAEQIGKLLHHVFAIPNLAYSLSFRSQVYGTANYAIGLAAYHTNRRNLSRRFLFRALVSWPKFLLNRKLVFTLLKSYLNPSLINRLKRAVRI